MIKVVYDHQIFSAQKYGGVSRIFYELGKIISTYEDFDVKIHGGLYINQYINKLPKSVVMGRIIPAIPKSTNLLLNVNNYYHEKWLKNDTPDILHKTFFNRTFELDRVKKSKSVITVYDMIHEKFMKWDTKFIKIKAEAIKNADHIMCISEHTRKDLLEMLDIAPEKVSTVYLGHSFESTVELQSSSLISHPYILYVGSRKSLHKNFSNLLKAYAINQQLKDNFRLVCFGHRPFSQKETDLMKNLGLSEKNVLHFSGDDTVLAEMYSHASAFVYPSLYEGFGIPPLEAMSLNCPVVCSNASSIPEVVGSAGEYFDPYEIESISQAIERVVFSSERQSELIEKGKERINVFSWDKCAYETSSIYRQLIN
jgi:glycosyltransferase involved in cell wall biosynthesis